MRKAKCSLSFFTIEDPIIDDPILIKDHKVDFYHNLFSNASLQPVVDFSMVNRIAPCLVTLDDNRYLTVIPSINEVKMTVFGLDPSNAPGPNGFSCSFYQCSWSIIEGHVTNVVQDFFRIGNIYKGLNLVLWSLFQRF